MGILKNSRSEKNSTHMKEEMEGQISSGTTHRLAKMLKQKLRNNSYTYWINILVEIINIARSSIVIMSKLVRVAWII